MKSFRDRLAEALAEGATPEEAYDRAVAGVGKAALVEHFRPVGLDEARHIRRLTSRRAENQIFGPRGRRLQVAESPERPPVDVRAILLGATFTVGGRTVSWGSATADDHEQRADEQDQRAASLSQDAERHRRAAKLLREAEAETLEDVEVEQLEDLLDE